LEEVVEMPKKLTNMEITAIALVGKPANKRRFLMFKAEREAVSKPYSGPKDKTLPENVQKLPKEKKEAWVKAFNSAWEGYKKDNDKNYDNDKTLQQNKERYCFAVANAVVNRMKSEQGGDEMEKTQTMTIKLDASDLEEQLGELSELIKSLGGEGVEKKGAVLNKDNLKMLKQVRDLLTKVLTSAGVEKEEVDPPQEEPEEKVEAAEQPVLTKEEAEKLKADADKLCTPDSFEAMLNARMDGGETE